MKDFTSAEKLPVLQRAFNWFASNFHATLKPFQFHLRLLIGGGLSWLHGHSSQETTHNQQSLNSRSKQTNEATNNWLWQLSFYLKEPLAEVKKLIKTNRKHLQNIETLRNHPQSNSMLVQHVNTIEIPQKDQFRQFDLADKHSKIIVSFHYGDFVYGLHKLLAQQQDAGKTLVLSQRKSTEPYLKNMAIAFGAQAAQAKNQLLLDEVRIKDLAVVLRRPKSRLVMFADLPGDYGETIEVSFLGRKAHFPRSVALLALASKVNILPVICIKTKTGQRVEIGKEIEARLRSQESKTDAITRITQTQIDFFEYFFIQDKSQWRYLQYLPNYFVEKI